MDERQIPAVGAKIQLGGHADPLMRHPDEQPVADIVKVAGSRKELQEVCVLEFLHSIERCQIGKECPALRLSYDEFVEAFGDVVRPTFGKRLQTRQSLEVLIGQFIKRKPALELFVIELQNLHVIG